MIPVMIVDDELIVRVALRSIVDWEALGFRIVAEARDGREGLQKFRALRPRLILTDVMMPELTGLQMMEEIRREDPRVQFVVLSAYEDFSFAQQAVRMHAEEYLLKATMLEDDLAALLRRMFRKLSDAEAPGAPPDGDALAAALAAGEPGGERLRACLGEGPYEAAFCRPSGRAVGEQDARVLRSILDNLLSDGGVQYAACGWEGGVLLVTAALPEARWPRLARLMRGTVEQYLNAALRVGVAGPDADASRLAARAREAAAQTLFAPEEPCCRYRPAPARETPFVRGEWLAALREELLLLRADAAEARIAPLFETLARTRDQAGLYELILALSALLCELRGMTEPDKPERVIQIDRIDRIEAYYAASVHAAVAWLREYRQAENAYVAQARAYIAARYAEPMTLARVAQALHLSPSYLGKLFYAETGAYLMDYVSDVRIDRACARIAQGGESLARIAADVGFTSQSYFTRSFQKRKGISPREYRKQCAKVKKDDAIL